MSEFIALPVGQGDSFYFSDNDFSILVDGGKSVLGFPRVFNTYITKNKEIDAIVCTHNDADHANGVIGFLESDLICKEIWLPSIWVDLLPDLMCDFFSFAQGLINEKIRSNNLFEASSFLKSKPKNFLLDDEYTIFNSFSNFRGSDDQLLSLKELINGYDKVCEWPNFANGHFFYRKSNVPINSFYFYVSTDFFSLVEDDRKLIVSAILTANRIRKICLLAIQRKINIRWFDYGFYGLDKVNGYGVVPLNSREVFF